MSALAVNHHFLEQTITQHEGGNKSPSTARGGGQRGLRGGGGKTNISTKCSGDSGPPLALRVLRFPGPTPGHGNDKHKLTCAGRQGGWGVEGQAPARNPAGWEEAAGTRRSPPGLPPPQRTPTSQSLSPTSALCPASPSRAPLPSHPAGGPPPPDPLTFPFLGLPLRNRVTRLIALPPLGPE